MAVQNLISAEITQEAKNEIQGALAMIKDRLNFLLALQPEEIKGLFKAANGYAPFIEKAINFVNTKPELMSTLFDIAEFKRDFALIKDLTLIANEISQLENGIQNTLMAANSDALAEALEVYGTVKLNRNRVPGLNVVAEDMGVLFQRAGKKSATPQQAAENESQKTA